MPSALGLVIRDFGDLLLCNRVFFVPEGKGSSTGGRSEGCTSLSCSRVPAEQGRAGEDGLEVEEIKLVMRGVCQARSHESRGGGEARRWNGAL